MKKPSPLLQGGLETDFGGMQGDNFVEIRLALPVQSDALKIFRYNFVTMHDFGMPGTAL